MTKPLFTISIAVHDRADLTQQCLAAVQQHSPSAEVIVFDNASGHETGKILKQYRVEVLRSETNLGFGAAHRTILGYARGTYFVVLNNDVIVEHGWLEIMRMLMLQHPHVGIVGPLSSSCKLDKNGVGSFTTGVADYVEGSCLMLPTWLARREGLFDPAYEFAYCEDADLSLRLRQRGLAIAFTDQTFTHHRAATVQLVKVRKSVNIDEYHRKNHEVLRAKWGRYLQTRRFEQKIGIRRTAAHGDVLLLTPIVRALRERNAHLEIVVETQVPEVLAGNPNLRTVNRLSREAGYAATYDLDLCYEKSPKKHIIEAYAEACALPSDIDKALDIHYDVGDGFNAKSLVGGRKVAVIHPGVTAWNGRNWATAKWSALSIMLAGRGFTIAVVGNKQTPKLQCETIDLRGATISYTAAVMHNSKLFVGIDSFPLHIAQALQIPTVGVFGAINPELRLIGLPFLRSARAPVECLGCHHEIPPPVNESQCRYQRVHCMEDLTVTSVLTEIDEALRTYTMNLETSKIRDRVIQYCQGIGIDIGCGDDKITEGAIGFDKNPGPFVDVIGDASMRMHFGDGEFDFVYSSHALEDITDTVAALAEWVRILRTGGHLIIQVPHPEHYKGFNQDHVHPGWNPTDLSQLAFNAGCKVIEAFEDVGMNRYSAVVVARKNE